MGKAPPRSLLLDGPTDTGGFRAVCGHLLADAVAPDQVRWLTSDETEACFFRPHRTTLDNSPPAVAEPTPPPKVPVWFDSLCETVSLHRDAGRFGLLYRLLWRLQHEPALRNAPLDADRVQALHMAAAVRRDLHRMKAFVRFRPISDPAATRQLQSDDPGRTLHVAWFEPEHHIVEAAAPFFARRFARMRWAILTPRRCVRWDGRALSFAPGADRHQAPPADANEQLWLTCYANAFDPARLQPAMMRKETPRRHWESLPGAPLVSPLAADAPRHGATMTEQSGGALAQHPPVQETGHPGHSGSAAEGGSPPAPLRRLKQATDPCRECPLGEHATQSVMGEGPLRARVMFVGDQPDDQDDLQGHPFVGPAGKLFNRALAEIGVPREQVYVSHAVKHFKYELRGNRRIQKSPAQQEIAACRHWLEDEITGVQPQALVALGATAARALMGHAVAVMKERGRWLVRPDGRRVFITLHPSSLLRMAPDNQAAAYAQWVQDLRRATEPGT